MTTTTWVTPSASVSVSMTLDPGDFEPSFVELLLKNEKALASLTEAPSDRDCRYLYPFQCFAKEEQCVWKGVGTNKGCTSLASMNRNPHNSLFAVNHALNHPIYKNRSPPE